MQYMMTGVVVVIISGLAIHLISLAIEGLYKVIRNRTTEYPALTARAFPARDGHSVNPPD